MSIWWFILIAIIAFVINFAIYFEDRREACRHLEFRQKIIKTLKDAKNEFICFFVLYALMFLICLVAATIIFGVIEFFF